MRDNIMRSFLRDDGLTGNFYMQKKPDERLGGLDDRQRNQNGSGLSAYNNRGG